MIAIIADTHLRSGDGLPAACVGHLRRADLILHAGDISTIAALGVLRDIGPAVEAVHGNVDEPALVELLPAALEVQVQDARIAITHDAGLAHGRVERLRARFPDASAVVFGHSHMPLLEGAGDGFQIFNPGSPTQRRRAPSRTMGIARVAGAAITFELVQV